MASTGSGARLDAAPRRTRLVAVLGAGLVAAAGLGLAALLRTPLPQPDPINPDDAVEVQVVAPVEPVVQPGSRMEVGELVDGYEHVPIAARPSDMDGYDPGYETAWIEPLPREAPRGRWSDEPTEVRPASAAQPPVRESRFGFDAPGPDYAAERRMRRERLDRFQQQAPATVSVGAGLRTESTFY